MVAAFLFLRVSANVTVCSWAVFSTLYLKAIHPQTLPQCYLIRKVSLAQQSE